MRDQNNSGNKENEIDFDEFEDAIGEEQEDGE